MDNLRVFSTFPTSQTSYKKKTFKSRKAQLESLPRDKNGMVKRSLENKDSLSRSEILSKLKKSKGETYNPNKEVKGQRFGDGFMADEVAGDIKKNDPKDPMTSEKLKKMLHSGAVNFSGKEQEILSKILNKN